MNNTQSKICQIKNLPSPKGHFLLGHLPRFKKDAKHLVLENWIKECGDLFKINFVGKEIVVSARPSINKEILKQRPHNFRRFSKIDEIFREIGIVGVFNVEGETWKRHRKPSAEALNSRNIRNYHPVVVEKSQALIDKWKKYASNNQSFDAQKEFMFFTIDITTQIAFGYQLNTINGDNNDFQKELEHIFPMINERITAPIPYWRWFKKDKDKQLDKALKKIESTIQKFIHQSKKKLVENPELRDKPSNFLEALLVESDNEKFTDEEVYGNVFMMLLAGEDTTSNSIAWAIYYLIQKPELVKLLRDEANLIYPEFDVAPNFEDLRKLPLAFQTAQEAIRLKPTTPQLYFEALNDLSIEGFNIPKGTCIITQNEHGQTNDEYFSHSQDFIPNRWNKKECPFSKHSPENMRAFGAGPRLCPGMQLAYNEMTILLSAICKNFDLIASHKINNVVEKFAFTMYPENLIISLKNP